MAQTHFYPCNETPESLCITCNEGLTAKDGTPGTDGTDGSKSTAATVGEVANNPDPPFICSVYCDDVCNNECEDSQVYCNINHQMIKDHGDVGSYPGKTVTTEDVIAHVWTKNYWNSLINKINNAETVGKEAPHVSPDNITSVTAAIGYPAVYTKGLYNQVREKLTNFEEASYDPVEVDQLITVSVANAIGTAFNSAKFSWSVCDVCNALGSQSIQECLCNCPTCAVCSTCPSCPICSTCPSCACNCSCSSCSCNCSSCSCPSCSTCAACPSPGSTIT